MYVYANALSWILQMLKSYVTLLLNERMIPNAQTITFEVL